MKVTLKQGSSPLVVSFPHSATFIPDNIQALMTGEARGVPDTDWFLPQLYDCVTDLGCSTIEAGFSRYVIDPNRPSTGENLYPGQPTPALCPLHCFDGSPIYLEGREPDQFEVGHRTAEYWRYYHDDLHDELMRVKHQYGLAVLFDAHSIRSQVPRLFPGTLPDLNLGTFQGASCDPELQQVLEARLATQDRFSWVSNGRFTGGFITRNYGQPGNAVHAVQLEMSQVCYMDESTGQWSPDRAAEIRPVIRSLLQTILDWAATQATR